MRDAFDATLAEIERGAAETLAAPPRFVAPPALSDAANEAAGCNSLWELAAAWTPEADPPPPPPPARLPSADPEAIAAELNLHALHSAADVARARRRFMWDNHPDRRTDLDRDLANRRVALANMQLDRALAELRKPEPSRRHDR